MTLRRTHACQTKAPTPYSELNIVKAAKNLQNLSRRGPNSDQFHQCQHKGPPPSPDGNTFFSFHDLTSQRYWNSMMSIRKVAQELRQNMLEQIFGYMSRNLAWPWNGIAVKCKPGRSLRCSLHRYDTTAAWADASLQPEAVGTLPKPSTALSVKLFGSKDPNRRFFSKKRMVFGP